MEVSSRYNHSRKRASISMPPPEDFDLDRFLRAQDPVFAGVLEELRAGWKRSHWMWFIFPQIDGLGFTSTTRFYSIRSRAEARAYVEHPILGPRLTLCAEILLQHPDRTAQEIFGPVDEMKLRSSMTLFAHVAGSDSVFARVLTRYFAGQGDAKTLELLGVQQGSSRNPPDAGAV